MQRSESAVWIFGRPNSPREVTRPSGRGDSQPIPGPQCHARLLDTCRAEEFLRKHMNGPRITRMPRMAGMVFSPYPCDPRYPWSIIPELATGPAFSAVSDFAAFVPSWSNLSGFPPPWGRHRAGQSVCAAYREPETWCVYGKPKFAGARVARLCPSHRRNVGDLRDLPAHRPGGNG